MESMRELHEQIRRLIRRREAMVQQIFTDPTAHAVAYILRRVRDAEGPDRETAIVDGTVAIMELMEGGKGDRAEGADTPGQG